MKKLLSSCLFVLLGNLLWGQQTAVIDSGLYQSDESLHMILANQDLAAVNSQGGSGNFSFIVLEETYQIDTPVPEFEYGQSYDITRVSDSEEYLLYFTQLPVVNITTDYEIPDEPRVPAEFAFAQSDGTVEQYFIGIEYRGAWSQTLPKKSLRIEFWADEEWSETIDVGFLDMRSDDDWNMQAMFNEPLRINNQVSWEVWDRIDSLYYIDEEPNAINGVRMRYVEVFVKGTYRGVYGLAERLDRKQLKLKKFKNGEIRGELYKSDDLTPVTKFEGIAPYDNNSDYWEGWEYKYPKPAEIIDWEDLYDYVDFVVHASEEDFLAEIADYAVVDNAVNYYIFMNLLHAADNRGKNMHIAKYTTDEPYFFMPWDLDGTFGNWWDGTRHPEVDKILSNGLYSRYIADCAEGGFVDKLKARWQSLRQQVITYPELSELFEENVNYLHENGVYEREFLAWADNGVYEYPTGNPDAYVADNLDYMKNWLSGRLDFLDDYFPEICEDMGTLDPKQALFSVYPNPAHHFLQITVFAEDAFLIYDMNGKQIRSGILSPGENRLDVSHLPAGIYIVRTLNHGHTKWIKK